METFSDGSSNSFLRVPQILLCGSWLISVSVATKSHVGSFIIQAALLYLDIAPCHGVAYPLCIAKPCETKTKQTKNPKPSFKQTVNQ